jgi:hypothetical protein
MSRYREIDLSRVRTYPVRTRSSLVTSSQFYRPPRDPSSFAQFWKSMPDVLGARDLKSLVAHMGAARARGAGILVMSGAHVIKTGLSPGLIRLMEDGWISALALSGAGAIHDLELAFFGRTSEDVAAQLPQGRFGMAGETSLWINQWTQEAARRQEGLGEGLGRAYQEGAGRGRKRSLLAAAYRLGIPATVHVTVGADINHQHPSFSGAAAGETSARDFRILCAQVQQLARGCALNLGSAVVLPEVFLKAVSVCTNLGVRFSSLTTAVFDFQRHYRPAENVVRRPTLQGGRGYYLIGHHEILLPLFIQGLIWSRGTVTRRSRRVSTVPKGEGSKRSRGTKTGPIK